MFSMRLTGISFLTDGFSIKEIKIKSSKKMHRKVLFKISTVSAF